MAKAAKKIKRKSEKLTQHPLFKKWKRRFGDKANIGSDSQIGWLIYDELRTPITDTTAGGSPKVDKKVLELIDNDFVKDLVELKKLKKMHGTYLKSIHREVVDGFLHAFFNLHTVRTYRSSSDRPNFQNFPVRDKLIMDMVRRCFIPRGPNRVIVEVDYAAIEVKIAACYNKDPNLISYIEDKSKDMHRDMAIQCYKMEGLLKGLPDDFWKGEGKDIRYCAKNMYVFPEFYGSYFPQCAVPLWMAIDRMGLTIQGKSVKEHLQENGIKDLGAEYFLKNNKAKPGTFVHHIKDVEEDFWKRRFKVYDKWKKKWYEQYLERGTFGTLTGFRIEGPLGRNDTINYPVQGSAFHCLLWALTKLVEEIKKRKMKTKICGQIHDSIVADVPLEEIDDFLALAYEIMTIAIRKHFPWIIVPLEVEAEACNPGESWADKRAREIAI